MHCSLCSKQRAWFVFVQADHLRLTAGADALADYQWTPSGKPHAFLHYQFCATCGVRVFARGAEGPKGGPFYAVAVASLDDANADELAVSIKYVDGGYDRYDRRPGDIRLM